MNRYIKYVIPLVFVFMSVAFAVYADDDSEASLRENPDMDSDKNVSYELPCIEYPSYIKLDANHIEMNGNDWSHLVALFDSATYSRVNIVHIGDSHLQADMATAVARTRLGEHYGSAGRALVVPFKLAGTNEPMDYSIQSSEPVEQSRLLKMPWPTSMGFTGIAIRPLKDEFEVTISAREPFDSIAVFYTGDSLDILNEGHVHLSKNIVSVALDDTCSNILLRLRTKSNVDIHGLNLLKGNSGIAYHVIGNNGATYSAYNGIDNFSCGIAGLQPALIVISLGTNEAFGHISDQEMRMQMHTLIAGLRNACPDAYMLLTTPAECQRRAYSGRGRKRRRTGFAVNANVNRLRNVILDFARSEKIPVYDFYEVAGGNGASAKWLRDGMMNKDRIHLLRPGYIMQGHLFTDAIENALNSFRKPNS